MHQFLKSILFYFEVARYMFRTVFLSVIGSIRLYIQHQVYVIQVQVQRLLASKQLMTDRKTVRNM